MKVAVLCLCLISITAAWPVIQSKQHAISASSEEKYDSRGHHLRRYYDDHVNSHSQESQQHPQSDLASSQQTLYSSEESVDVPEQPHFPDVSSKSHEDVDDDDDDDDNDSNDTDESEEVVTSFPTDIPVTVEPFPTFPFTRGDNAGRGDSVAYRMRAKAALLTAKAKLLKSVKLHKAAKKLIYDATEEDESDLDADSQRSVSREDSASRSSLRKHASSVAWSDQSHGRDSSEQDSDLRARSLENDSRHKSDSHEAEGDSSKSGVRGDSLSSVESRERGDSHPSVESRESRDRVSAELSDDISNQTLESAEDSQDRHSIESNEVTL
ncbi:PREDICTED: osteopontin [Ficedula albicollis]|uniref:osteopontin n=1 Tax=Ficedula albicollis TaxID=59894 RepID=UPI0007AD81A5|nr:PREDICTED: osteopontin [Ficedula albicollis]